MSKLRGKRATVIPPPLPVEGPPRPRGGATHDLGGGLYCQLPEQPRLEDAREVLPREVTRRT
eukprot:5257529-Pyramimonas_sp.AAC.1